jgi:hypothetical protein
MIGAISQPPAFTISTIGIYLILVRGRVGRQVFANRGAHAWARQSGAGPVVELAVELVIELVVELVEVAVGATSSMVSIWPWLTTKISFIAMERISLLVFRTREIKLTFSQ